MKQKMNKISVVSLSAVSKTFEEKEVLRGIAFDIKRGEIISLLGPSGCGKTTILRLIAGFESLDGGVISVMGKPVAGRGFSIPPDKRSVGMVFQDYALFPHMTVAQNVLYGLKGFDRARQKKILSGMLRLSGLLGYEKRYPHQLSGGEQQRVAVARALAPCPDALLLDEPFSNLDADMRLRMRTDVLNILREARTTAILVTHDREEAFSLGDRVGVLNCGRLEQLDTPEILYHHPKTPFVARFVGHADFIMGEVINRKVVTSLGSFSLLSPLQEKKCMVMIRPDDIDFAADADGSAALVDRTFLGSENIYKIRLASGEIVRSIQPSTTVYQPGQSLRVIANLDHVVVLPMNKLEKRQHK